MKNIFKSIKHKPKTPKTLEERVKNLEHINACLVVIIALAFILTVSLFTIESQTRKSREYPFLENSRCIIIVKRDVNANKTIHTQMNDFLNSNTDTKNYLTYNQYSLLFRTFNSIKTNSDLDKKPTTNSMYFVYVSRVGPRK